MALIVATLAIGAAGAAIYALTPLPLPGDPFRWEQEHRFQPARISCLLCRLTIESDQGIHAKPFTLARQQTFASMLPGSTAPASEGLNWRAVNLFVPKWATYRKMYSRMKTRKSQPG